MKTKHVIALTETERNYAQAVVNNKTTAKTFKKRAQRILAFDTNVGQPESQGKIAKRVGVTPPTIFNTIKQFCDEGLESVL